MIGIINPLHFSEYWNSIPVLILKNIINKFNMTNLCGSPLKYLSKSMDKQWMLFSWLFKQWTILIQTVARIYILLLIKGSMILNFKLNLWKYYRLSKKDKLVITNIRVLWSDPYHLLSFSARKTHPISDTIAVLQF